MNGKSQAVKFGLPIAKGVAYFNSCVNPLLYFCMGVDLKRHFHQSLLRVYQRALAEDWDDCGTAAQSQEQTVNESNISIPK